MKTIKWVRAVFALLCLTLVLGVTLGTTKASVQQQGTDFAAIDAYVAEQAAKLGIPGLALGIIQDGQIAHLQGFGLADSAGRPVTPQTPFHIGSVTKSFTALAVMQLVEAGKIDLDAPVQRYLPWFELADKEAAAQMTVRHLLNQTTGISTKDGNRFWSSQQDMEETVRGLGSLSLTHPVGTNYQYSNTNFAIAGLIVEKVSGQSYADYVTEHIFEPLDMRHSYTSRPAARADGLAEGHIYMFGRPFASEGVSPPSGLPVGFLIASAEDMAHYLMAQLNDGQYGDGSILSAQGIAELHTPAALQGESHYAMGWSVGERDGMTAVSHSGDTGRNHAMAGMVPARGLGIILLANATGFEQQSQVDELFAALAFNIIFDTPLADIALPAGLRFQYWGILLTPLLQILGIAFVWRRRQRIKVWGAAVTVILNLAAVYALLQVSLQIITLPSMFRFYPELGYGLAAAALIGIGWSAIFTAQTLLMRSPKYGFSKVDPNLVLSRS